MCCLEKTPPKGCESAYRSHSHARQTSPDVTHLHSPCHRADVLLIILPEHTVQSPMPKDGIRHTLSAHVHPAALYPCLQLIIAEAYTRSPSVSMDIHLITSSPFALSCRPRPSTSPLRCRSPVCTLSAWAAGGNTGRNGLRRGVRRVGEVRHLLIRLPCPRASASWHPPCAGARRHVSVRQAATRGRDW